MPPRISIREANRRRRNSTNRTALIVFLFAVGLLILLGVGVWLYQLTQRAQFAGKGNPDAPAAPFGLPGLPNLNPLAPAGEMLWPKLQGKWVKAEDRNEPLAGFLEFTADRRFRTGAPWVTFRKADGRESPYFQDDPITRIESTGAGGEFRIWLKLDFIQYEGYQDFKLVGDTLFHKEGGPERHREKTVAYVKVR